MFINGLYDFITFLKNQGQARYFPPEEVIDALNRAVSDVYAKEYKHFEETGRISDALAPFKKSAPLTKTGDIFLFPDDYRHVTSHRAADPDHSGETNKIIMITDGEWEDKVDSVLTPATNSYPFMRIVNGGFEVIPSAIASITISYIKVPVKAVYAYDIVSGDFVFKETGSVDPEFPEFVHNDLIAQTLKYLGVVLNDSILMQFQQFQPAS